MELAWLLDVHQLRAKKRPLLPPLELDDVPVHCCYASIPWANFVNDAFGADERSCHSGPNSDAVADFKFTHGNVLPR